MGHMAEEQTPALPEPQQGTTDRQIQTLTPEVIYLPRRYPTPDTDAYHPGTPIGIFEPQIRAGRRASLSYVLSAASFALTALEAANDYFDPTFVTRLTHAQYSQTEFLLVAAAATSAIGYIAGRVFQHQAGEMYPLVRHR